MTFYMGSIVVTVIIGLLFKYSRLSHPFSRAVLMLIILNVIASICLLENIVQNQNPVLNDGIGITNSLAYLIIGEDGWSHELFKSAFDQSIFMTKILLAVYLILLITEEKWPRKKRKSEI